MFNKCLLNYLANTRLGLTLKKTLSTAFVGVDVSSVDSLAIALDNVSGKHRSAAAAALKHMGATDDVIDSALKMVNATDMVDKSQLESILSAEGLSTEFTEQSKAILNNTNALGKLSADQAKAILVRQGLSDAEADAAVKQLLSAGATDTATISMGTYTAALWANIKAVGVWLLTNPVGQLILLAGAYSVVTWGIEKYTEAIRENAAESREAYSETMTEIEDLNSQLETTKAKIQELNALENPSIVEQDELKELKETNDELERELRIKQALAKYEQQKASEDTIKEIGTYKYKTLYTKSDHSGGTYYAGDSTVDIWAAAEERLEALEGIKNMLEHYDDEMDALVAKHSAGEISDGVYNRQYALIKKRQAEEEEKQGTYVNELTEMYNTLEGMIDSVDDSTEAGAEILKSWSTLVDGMDLLANDFEVSLTTLLDSSKWADISAELKELGAQGKITAEMLQTSKFSDFLVAVSQAGDYGNSLEEVAQNVANALNQEYTEAVDDAEESTTTLTEALEDLATSYTNLKKAQDEMDENGYLTYETATAIIKELTEAGEDYTDYLYMENGQLKLNTAAYEALSKAKMEQIIANKELERADIAGQLQDLNTQLESPFSGNTAAQEEELVQKAKELHDQLETLDDELAIEKGLLESVGKEASEAADSLEELADAGETFSSAVSTVQSINSAIEEYGDLTSLSTDETMTLVSKFPALIKYLTQTDDGYRLNADALELLKANEISEANNMMQAEAQKAKAIIASTNSIANSLANQIELYKSASDFFSAYVAELGGAKASALSGLDMSKVDLDAKTYTLSDGSSVDISGNQAVLDAAKIEQYSEAYYAYKNVMATWESEASKLGTGTTSSGSSGSSVEAYTAEIDTLYESTLKLGLIEDELSKNNDEAQRLSNIDFNGKRKNLETENDLLSKKNEILHEQNEIRRGLIDQNLELLRQQGFEVEYDPEGNYLEIKNLAHLNELKGKNQEETNELIKKYEDLIDTTSDLVDANKENSASWWDNYYAIKENNEALYELTAEAYQNYIDTRNRYDNWGTDSEVEAVQRAMDYLEKSYAEDLIEYEKYIEEKISLNQQLYDAQKSEIERVYGAIKDQISDMISAEKDALNEQLDELDEEIDSYTEEQEAARDKLIEGYDDEIERLKAIKEERSEATEEAEKLLAIDQAREALEKAKQQRTKRKLVEGQGWTWVADEDAIADAQQNLNEAIDNYDSWLFEKNIDDQIDELEKLREAAEDTCDSNVRAFEDSRKKLRESIEAQINELSDLSSAWSDSLNIDEDISYYQDALDFIADFEDASYEERLRMLRDFADSYKDILSEISDTAASTEDNAWDSVGGSSSGSSSGSGSGSGSSHKEDESYFDETGTLIFGKNKLVMVQADGTAPPGLNKGDQVATHAGTYEIDKAWDTDGDGINDKYQSSKVDDKETYGYPWGEIIKYFAQGGVADYTGMAMLHGTPNHSETVFNARDSKKLYDLVHNADNLSELVVPDMFKAMQSKLKNIIPELGQNMSFTMGDVHVHEVQDADRLSNDIVTRLPNLMLQKLYKKS